MQEGRKEVVTIVTIDDTLAGQRLDNYLFKCLKGVPKSRIYRMLREGEVRVNRRRAQPEQRLSEGDQVRIPPVRVAAPAVEQTQRPGPGHFSKSLLPHTLYRDDSLLILNKPAGQAVHGGSGVSLGIIEQLRLEMPEQRYLELVHRLDKETSGVLVVALKRSALTEMHRKLRQGEVRKCYQTLALGHWADALRHVNLPLHKQVNEAGERRVSVWEGGQTAHTVFRLIRHYPGFTLLKAELKTGRTHQIRVHLAALKHPIAGDDKYGDFELNRALKKQGLKRMFLHAASLEFKHPITGEDLRVEAPLPGELEGFLNRLGVS